MVGVHLAGKPGQSFGVEHAVDVAGIHLLEVGQISVAVGQALSGDLESKVDPARVVERTWRVEVTQQAQHLERYGAGTRWPGG